MRSLVVFEHISIDFVGNKRLVFLQKTFSYLLRRCLFSYFITREEKKKKDWDWLFEDYLNDIHTELLVFISIKKNSARKKLILYLFLSTCVQMIVRVVWLGVVDDYETRQAIWSKWWTCFSYWENHIPSSLTINQCRLLINCLLLS